MSAGGGGGVRPRGARGQWAGTRDERTTEVPDLANRPGEGDQHTAEAVSERAAGSVSLGRDVHAES